MKSRFPVREVIFGLEDSIVSTMGVVVGIAAGTDDRYIVVLSALVVVAVESLSMTAGAYLSNKSQMEIDAAGGGVGFLSDRHLVKRSVSESFVMGISYILGGFVSVIPFFFLEPFSAIIPSVILSILVLFMIGYIKGKIAKINRIKSGLEMSLISLTAAIIAYLIGRLAQAYLT